MNRRELAKNGFLGLCGFLTAKLIPEKKEALHLTQKGSSDYQSISMRFYASDEEGNMREVNASTLTIPDGKTIWR